VFTFGNPKLLKHMINFPHVVVVSHSGNLLLPHTVEVIVIGFNECDNGTMHSEPSRFAFVFIILESDSWPEKSQKTNEFEI